MYWHKKSLLISVLFLCLIYIFILITGCGIVNKETPVTQSLEISTHSPAIGATGIASTASISITFNRSVNTPESNGAITIGASHTAGSPEGSIVSTWSNENKTLTISGITGWSSGAARVVNIISNSTEAFKDYLGNKLTNGTELWRYTLASGGGQYVLGGTVTYGSTKNILVFASTNKGTEGVVATAHAQTNTPYSLTVHNGTYYVFAIYPTNESPSDIGIYDWNGSGGIGQATQDAHTVTVSGADVTGKDFVLAPMYLAPTVASVSPAVGASGISNSATLSVTFSTPMDTTYTTNERGFYPDPVLHTAGYPSSSPVCAWSNGDQTFTLSGINWPGAAGTRVYVTSTYEGFKSAQGAFLANATLVWNYTVAGSSTPATPEITSHDPTINATGISQSATLQVTFDKEMDVAAFSPNNAFTGEAVIHTAGMPTGEISVSWSPDNKTLIFSGITSWSGGPGSIVSRLTSGESWRSLEGGIVPPGTQLWKFTLAGGGGGPTPEVESQIPALDATDISPTSDWVITFTTSMDVNSASEHMMQPGTSPLHTAGSTTGSPSGEWSSDHKTLTITGWTGWNPGGSGAQVNLISSAEALRSYGGVYLPVNSPMWRYRLQ
ncbi:MAG: Ig-like domain-containing protein [Candidatus Saganbacteria bacterium]|nr:Ig-like domain-containing protein [Candidatus Saganbacteria bacterium]